MLSLNTEADLLRAVADTVRRHRLAQGLRQIDLAQKSGVAIATLRRFERSAQIGFLGLAKLLTTLGLTDAFIASFQQKPARDQIAKIFSVVDRDLEDSKQPGRNNRRHGDDHDCR